MLNVHLKSRAVLRWVFVMVVIAVAALMGRLIHSRMSAQDVRASRPIPYTAILRETVYAPDGTATVTGKYTQAARSDGSVVWRAETNQALTERSIQFASGTEVTIDEIADAKSSMVKHGNPGRLHRDPNSNCMNSLTGDPMASPPEVFSGEETVAGHRTVKLTQGNATGWYAVDCGCAMVKSRHDWGGGSVTEKHLVALIPGEPEAGLFVVPATAKEMPPSELMRGSAKRRIKPGPEGEEALRQLTESLRGHDEYYYKHRPVK